MPSGSSSSSRMMIRGVTISMTLLVVRPMPTLRNRRSISGILDTTGTPYSVRVLVELLDATQEDRAAVGDGDGRRDRGRGRIGELNRGLRSTAAAPPRPLPPTAPPGKVKVCKLVERVEERVSVSRT